MADPSRLTELAISAARNRGFELAGVCDADPPESLPSYREWLTHGNQASMGYLEESFLLRSSPEKLLAGVRSIVAIGLNYNQPNPSIPGNPRIARYALGRDYHKVLRGKLRGLQHDLELVCEGHQFRICVDSAPLMEREYAHRAGLGWFGKNTCLIDSKRGSWFVLGFLLTTALLEPTPRAFGGCGTCRRCIDACPTGAIVFDNGRWVVNSGRCISYLTIEHRGEFDPWQEAAIGEWTFGCDICQEVCPFNEARLSQPLRSTMTDEADFRARRWPHLTQISQLGLAEWDLLTQGSPVRRAGLEGLKRNARANLKNATRAKEPTGE